MYLSSFILFIIGKSVFAYYFLWRMLNEPQHHSVNGRRRALVFGVDRENTVVIRGDEVSVMTAIEYSHNKISSDKEAVRIVDYDAHEEPPLSASNTIILASPNESRYHEFMKYDGTRYIMNPWSKEDVWALWERNFRSFPEDELKKSYEIFGGIPRFLFNSELGLEMKAALDATGGKYKKVVHFCPFDENQGESGLF